jgi:alkanesulfonate monooxygenase SsuD/methylene tetrahydromethanopterin reductase-like flavin-dependent oxidoreductase (luciferase family)
MEFFLYLPQTRVTFERLVATARAAEAAGFAGMTGMDHLVTPGAEDKPVFESMVVNTWIAAHTSRLKVSSLVLCDAFRHPAVLAKQAVSLDHASGGRFELGIGWGSFERDFTAFGVAPQTPRERAQRLRETLEVLRGLWAGETVTFQGEHLRLEGAVQSPTPLGKIPILVGGVGPKTLAMVKDYADWCNLDVRYLDRLEGEASRAFRAQIGSAKISMQQMVAYVHREEDRETLGADAMRRFWHSNPLIATGPQLREHYARMAEKGVERVYAWFCDFAPAETLEAFAAEVIEPLSGVRPPAAIQGVQG